MTIACRKCKAQVTAPETAAAEARLWPTLLGWLAFAAFEVLAALAIAAMIVALSRARPPAGLPFVEGLPGSSPQLPEPGKPLVVEWATGRAAVGGHFRITGQSVILTCPGRHPHILSRVDVTDEPWPESLLETNSPSASEPILMSLEVLLPADEALVGQPLRLEITVALEYPEQAKAGGPIELRQALVKHEQPLVLATEAQVAALARYRSRRRLLGWGIFWCAAAALAAGIGACAVAQKRVKIRCPKCGRMTVAVYYHERGNYHLSACPHA